MKNLFYVILGTLMLAASTGCDEQPYSYQPIHSDGPGPLSELSVKNLPGGADISYKLPSNPDLLYVKAEYKDNTLGTPREVVSSIYSRHIHIEGLGSTAPVEVTLTAIDRSRNVSAPVKITIDPLTPPIAEIAGSVTATPDFGGPAFMWENAHKLRLLLYFFDTDENGKYRFVNNFLSQQLAASFSLRGYTTELQKFGVVIKDQYGNLTDTLPFQVSPLFEMELPKSKIRPMELTGDAGAYSGWPMENIFNGNTSPTSVGYHTKTSQPYPMKFTFDLGQTYKLSRYVVFYRHNPAGSAPIYAHGNIKRWDVYGRNDAPPADGSWTGWTLIGQYANFKPSGLPVGQVTEEDLAYALKGEDFPIPLSLEPVRYIRFNVHETWANSGFANIIELTFYGSDIL